MKQFGDSVVYVRHDGVQLNALVVDSRMIGGAERLQVIYFDPEIGPLLYRNHSTPSTAFDVAPFTASHSSGWREADGVASMDAFEANLNAAYEANHLLYESNHVLREEVASAKRVNDAANAELLKLSTLNPSVPPPQPSSPNPSVADLDTVAQEQKAADDTATQDTSVSQ